MKRLKSMLALGAAIIAAPANAGPPRNDYERAALEAVQSHIDVYRSWDLDAFVGTFAEDAALMVDGKASDGRAEIRDFYANNFADDPHDIQIIESGMRNGLVYLTMSYTFADGYERCCSFAEYFVKDGKISYLKIKMTNRTYRTTKGEPD